MHFWFVNFYHCFDIYVVDIQIVEEIVDSELWLGGIVWDYNFIIGIPKLSNTIPIFIIIIKSLNT